MDTDERMNGQPVELLASRYPGAGGMDAYERLLGDAMDGDATLFAREDYVEEAWRIVDPVLQEAEPRPMCTSREPGARARPKGRSRPGGVARPEPDGLTRARCDSMKLHQFDDELTAASAAAVVVADAARGRIAARGRFTVAYSGGHTLWLMLRALAGEAVPWAG